MRRQVLFLIILISSNFIFSQNYFQKIYKLGDTTSFFQDIYLKDSFVYLGATVGHPFVKFQASLVKLDSLGNVLQLTKNTNEPYVQMSCFGKTDFDTNYRGNLVFAFTEWLFLGADIGIPRLFECSLNGEITNDYMFNNLYEEDSLLFEEISTLLINKDSTYYFSLSYIDLATDNNHFPSYFDGQVGVLLLKLDKNLQIIWSKKFKSPPSGGIYLVHNLTTAMYKIDDESIMLKTEEGVIWSGSNSEQDWSKTHYYTIDSSGAILDHKIFQDTENDFSGSSFIQLEDGSKIVSYSDSQLTGTAPNGDYFEHRPVLARIDSNMTILWKDTLMSKFGNANLFTSPNKILRYDDTTIIYSFQYYWDMSDTSYYVSNRIENRHINGTLNWYRDYVYYPLDNWNDPQYQILDLERSKTGDFYFAGQVLNTDLTSQNKSGQNAYLLKTNCLGYIGNPVSNFSYQISENNELTFYNLSTQAGSYEWSFGDNTFLQSGKNNDTVKHTFLKDTIYQVSLKAFSCNNVFDSLNLKIDLRNKDTLIPPNNSNLLTIAPNPISNGELITAYIGSISDKKHKLIIYNELGQVITTYFIPTGNVYLTLNPIKTNALYFISLFEEDKVLTTTKITIL